MPFSKEASSGRSGRSVFSIHITIFPPLHFPLHSPIMLGALRPRGTSLADLWCFFD